MVWWQAPLLQALLQPYPQAPPPLRLRAKLHHQTVTYLSLTSVCLAPRTLSHTSPVKRVNPPHHLNTVFHFAVSEQTDLLTTTPSDLPSTSNQQTNHSAPNTVAPSQALPASNSTTQNQSLPTPPTLTPTSLASTPPSTKPVILTTGWSLLTEMAIYDI